MAYPALTDIKTYIGTSSTSDDTLLTALLAAAKKFIEGPEGAGRAFEVTADSTRNFDPTRDVAGRTLYLDEDLCQITSITNGDGATITSSQYVTEPRNRTPWFALTLKSSTGVYWTYTSDPEDAIEIEGRWGYSTTAPDDIALACRKLVKWEYERRKGGAEADRAVVMGDGTVFAPTSVPADIMRVIRSYRKVSV